MTVRFDVLTLFPEYFGGLLASSLLGKAIEKGLVTVELHQIRDFTTDKHRTADDTPYGGGHGMVMKVEPVVAALESVATPAARRILLSARGPTLTQAKARELASVGHLILLCGRYEGVDERVCSFVDEELSIGDYVLSGGEAAAAVLIDAVARIVPGVLGNPESLVSESFAEDLLEYPQYTRPETFRGLRVPEVLLSGNHAAVERWRREEAVARTKRVRPDLLERDPPAAAPGPSKHPGKKDR